MAEIINLNRVKKARVKTDAKALAAQNRAKFSRSKAGKDADRALADALQRRVDSHKRDTESDA